MPIRFYDPRNNTITVYETDLIQNFMTELEYTYNKLDRQDYATKKKASSVNKAGYEFSYQKTAHERKIKDYLTYILELNKENKTLRYLQFDLYDFEYALLDIFEHYNIPVRLEIDYYSTLEADDIIPLITGKQCIKAMLHKNDAFARTDDLEFIKALISTDIYDFNTDDVDQGNKISFLISSNKLIILKIEYSTNEDFSQSFKELLASWNPDNILRELIFDSIAFIPGQMSKNIIYTEYTDNPTDDKAQLLATMIQSNKHLQKFALRSSRLGSEFMSLLTTHLNSIPISGTQPVSLDFSHNRYFSDHINNFVTCLNQAAISELNLTNSDITDDNVIHIAVELRTNTILTSLILNRSKVKYGIQVLCRAIIANQDSQLIKLDLANSQGLEIADYVVIGELIEADKLYELYLLDAESPTTDKRYIFDILTRALWNNYYLTTISFPIDYRFIAEGYEDPRLFLKALLFRKPLPLNITNLIDAPMVKIMQMIIENYNISNKTLIDILNEY